MVSYAIAFHRVSFEGIELCLVCVKGVCSGCVLRVCCGRMVSYASVSFEGIESHLACFKGVLRSNGFV